MADPAASDRKTAVVSGASGFMGRHLTRRLLLDGWDVTALHRRESSVPSWMRRHCTLVEVTNDTAQWTDAVASAAPESCFHLAAQSVPVHSAQTLGSILEANVVFGTHLLEAVSQRVGARFVNVGSMWQHHESRPYGPSSLYAATKQAFVDIVQFFVECQGLLAATVEFPDTYGPDDDRRKLLRLLLDASASDTALQMSPGQQVIELVHVDDVVEALLVTNDLTSSAARSYQVLGEVLQLQEFVDLVAFTSGRSVPVDWGARPYRPRETMQPWRFHQPLPGWSRTRSIFIDLAPCIDVTVPAPRTSRAAPARAPIGHLA